MGQIIISLNYVYGYILSNTIIIDNSLNSSLGFISSTRDIICSTLLTLTAYCHVMQTISDSDARGVSASDSLNDSLVRISPIYSTSAPSGA